ncbi:MAG: hypothetical protein ACQEQV_03250 [Fibrobacterota bacterium]
MKKGIRISPAAHKARLYFLILITPLISWYAHQQYTNPAKKHPEIRLIKKSGTAFIHGYHATSFSTSDHVYIALDSVSASPRKEGLLILPFPDDSLTILHPSGVQEQVNQITTPTVSVMHRGPFITVTGGRYCITAAQSASGRGGFVNSPDILIMRSSVTAGQIQTIRNRLAPRLTLLLQNGDTAGLPEAANIIAAKDAWKEIRFSQERYGAIRIQKNK